MWEAENCETFSNITSKQVIPTPQPPLKDAVSQLLEKPEPEPPVVWSLSLSPEDLLILIYGIVLSRMPRGLNANLIRSYSFSRFPG